jgi:hypothetical protein
MIWRSLVVWLLILVLANINGALREALLIKTLGQVAGRAISTLLLSAIILGVSWFTIGWIGPSTKGDALRIGLIWLALTLAFEFLAGHYLFRQPWPVLLKDYDLRRGSIWVLVPLVVLAAPWLTARLKGLLHS